METNRRARHVTLNKIVAVCTSLESSQGYFTSRDVREKLPEISKSAIQFHFNKSLSKKGKIKKVSYPKTFTGHKHGNAYIFSNKTDAKKKNGNKQKEIHQSVSSDELGAMIIDQIGRLKDENIRLKLVEAKLEKVLIENEEMAFQLAKLKDLLKLKEHKHITLEELGF